MSWLHVESGEVCEYVGEDRGADGTPYAVMRMANGATARIDPLALMTKDGPWRKIDTPPVPEPAP